MKEVFVLCRDLNLGARAGHFGLRFAAVFFGDKEASPKKELPLRVPGAYFFEVYVFLKNDVELNVPQTKTLSKKLFFSSLKNFTHFLIRIKK